MKENKREVSLRRQILFIVLLCWLIPVVMLLTMMIWYLGGAVGSRAEENYSNQLVVHLRMCADRLNSAVEASRLASYDTTIREAWNEYQRDGNYAALYRETRGFLNLQYQSDSRFLYAVFWFSSDPEEMQLTTFNSGLGGVYNQISAWWAQDFEGARTLAADLDTAVGFLERDGRLYLIRNLMDSQYNVIGVLALALYQPYYFEDLSALGWASPVELTLGEGTTLALGGGGPIARDRGVLTGAVEGSGYQLNARAALVYEVLLAPIRSYQVALGVMLALLVPLLLLTVTFFRRKVSTPMEHLMSGAREIESGHLGYQVNYLADTLEFRYLTDSFNHMSGRLRAQFDRLYREEIALRDAQIKALQAHINPHFLNNTLEIINSIVTYKTATQQTVNLVLDTIRQAVRREKKKVAAELHLHSDQGFQYTSQAYFKLTKQYGITPSMSRRGNPYDNAMAENFFSILKTECIYRHKPATFSEADEMIDRYIHFYNHERIQSKTGVPPLSLRHSC